MKISVVIPTYNHAIYLPCAIDSVLNQTRPVDEIIVVDDGSTDNSREVIEQYGERVRYIYQKNAGVGAARNHGTREATGDWVAYLDADDCWFPDKIALQEKAIQRDPHVAFVYSGVSSLFPDGSISAPVEHVPADRIWPMLRWRNAIPLCSAMARRDAILAAGGFDESLKSCEDWDMWVRLRLGHRFASVPEGLSIYRVTPTSMSTNTHRMLEAAEIVRRKTLLEGLSLPGRLVVTCLLRSDAYFHAAVTAREIGAPTEGHYLLRSILQWPFPTYVPRRYLVLFRYLVGEHAFEWLRLKVGRRVQTQKG